jgi:hypothetical protein
MSVAAEIWKHPLLKIARGGREKVASDVIEVPRSGTADAGLLASLVQQIFFSTSAVGRTRILLAAAGQETNISAIAEQVGRVLSEMSGASVGLVENGSVSVPIHSQQHEFQSVDKAGLRSNSSPAGNRLFRLSPDRLSAIADQACGPREPVHLPFDYVVLAASVDDPMFPQLCGYCEGAVLVLTANRTRKESALRAKRILQQFDAELLGTVLAGRRFPIPNSIYRRL